MLAARIDRLPSEDKHLLQAVAVIGKDVPFALLQAIVDEPEEVLRRSLAHLQAAEFLYELHLFPEHVYTLRYLMHTSARTSRPWSCVSPLWSRLTTYAGSH
jgi:predicted ATPase